MSTATDDKTLKRCENLLLSRVPGLNGDELAMVLGTYLPGPAFVLDCGRDEIVAGNQAFLQLLGLDPSLPESLGLPWERVLDPDDRGVFHAWKVTALSNLEASFEVRIRDRAGAPVPVRAVLKKLRWKRQDYLVGFLEDIALQHKRELRLRQQVEEQKDRAIQAIKSSLSIYHLTEKIKSTPILTKRLLNAGTESDLFQEAADVLTSAEGLNYRAVTFLLLEGGSLEVAFSTREIALKSYPLTEDNRYSRFIRESLSPSENAPDGETLVPLKSRGRLIGVCEVVPYPAGQVPLIESGRVAEWQKDVLLTIGDIIAVSIDNLRLVQEIRRRSDMDSLTETFNRRYFAKRLAEEIDRANRYQRVISLLFVDVDKFKVINDTYGHPAGDHVLREIGALFARELRRTDIVCRYGGDEFVVLLPESDRDTAQETADKLLKAIRSHEFTTPDDPDARLSVSISIGVNTLGPGEDQDQFLRGADCALYAAKNAGRDRVEQSMPVVVEPIPP
jgi:diguanylate cyclase (GGDEF)-like protein